jgi:predicted NBD/HSP70 family sugar kinase
VLRPVILGHRSETVRRANLAAIVRALHLRGPLSRSSLVAQTGLTRSSIRALIGEFVAAGMVDEERAESLGTPGRPSSLVRPNPESATVLAIEIGVDSLAMALVGLGGVVLESSRIDRDRGHLGVDEIAADIAQLTAGVRADPRVRDSIVGVGVAVVGVVRRPDGLVRVAPNLGWRDVPLGERLATALGLPVPIAVANDADLGALGEARRGTARDADTVLFIAGDVGVGGGLIVDGVPLTGIAGYGGEVGHIPVRADGLPCSCGSHGCWETEIGAHALLRLAGRPVDGGRAEIEAVVAAAERGEPRAVAAVEEVGRWIGFGLAGLVNVFNPRLVVMGGLFVRMLPLVSDIVSAELNHRTLPATRRLVTVMPATLGIDASLIGAAELAFEPLLDDPAAWLRPRPLLRTLASA